MSLNNNTKMQFRGKNPKSFSWDWGLTGMSKILPMIVPRGKKMISKVIFQNIKNIQYSMSHVRVNFLLANDIAFPLVG